MPVFVAGTQTAGALAAALDVPLIRTTHQRGHLAAAAWHTPLEETDSLLALHLSGGTTDLLRLTGEGLEQIGGSLDLHAGQLVDRAGVAMGLSFPAGPELEALAERGKAEGSAVPFQRGGIPDPAADSRPLREPGKPGQRGI